MREHKAGKSDEKRLYNQQWYQAHKEQVKEASRQYRHDHPEQTREAQRRWREANREYLSEYNKAYQVLNQKKVAQTAREKRLAFFAKDPKAAWLHYTFQSARGRAKRKGFPYAEDLAGLELPDFCPVLGIPLQYRERRKIPAPDSPSLDRITPHLGYVLSNLRVISWRANVLKRDSSIDEVRRVLAYMEECLALEKTA